jgi:hypothetical protein
MAAVTRWELIRDVLVLQVKLAVDALRDLILSPLSLVAGVLDLLTGGQQPGRLFYPLLVAARRTEQLINLFGEADHVMPRPVASPSTDPVSIDAFVARFERTLVEQYQRGGVTASAKAAIDRSLDALSRARSPKA